MTLKIALHSFIATLLFCAIPASAAVLSAENETLVVRYDDAANTFSLIQKATGKEVVTEGHLLATPGATAQTMPAHDTVFGAGKQIEITYSDGAVSALQLYAQVPFLLVKTDLHNTTAAQTDVERIVPATFTIDLDKAAAELKTVGTGGLLAADKNPGSYLFLTCADPATRRGVVAGWITEDRGSGVLFSDVKDGKVGFKAQIDYGHLRIPAGKSAKLETLAIGVFDDARIGEELYADAIKKQYDIKLRPQTAVYCSWYAEKHGMGGDEKSTVELAKFAAKELKPYGFGVVQVDDQWQDGPGPEVNGPRRGFDRVRPDGPYPHGIAPVAAEVDNLGLTFGLWWLPFGRNYQNPEYKDRQDWFVKRENGKPYDTAWGGTCMDLTNPQVKEQLAKIAKLYRSWGVTYYKMDGLWTGAACEQIYVNDGYKDDHFGNTLPFHDPLVTNIEMYRDGLKLLRQNAGDDVFFSGCCISQNMREMTAIGLVDSMRVGPDASGDIRVGPIRGSRLYFMNGRIWWNDPDPAVVRAAGSGMGVHPVTLAQARMAASWPTLTGQFYLSSDWLPDLPAERIEVMKRTMLHHDVAARPVDYFDADLPTCWLVTDTKQAVHRDIIALFNFEKTELKSNYTCARLGLDPAKTYYAFDFWANQPVAPIRDEFKMDVPANSCRVIAVRAAEDHPVLLSTSRHVTQGMVDVTGETWEKNSLSGVSQVVAGDTYELRIAGLTDGGKQWKVASVSVSGEDKAAGVTVAQKEDPAILRVTIQSPVSRAVKWTITFNTQPLAAVEHAVTKGGCWHPSKMECRRWF